MPQKRQHRSYCLLAGPPLITISENWRKRTSRVLRTSQRAPLPVNHVDAGVAYLSSFQEIEAAIAVYSHHIGLCDLVAEAVKAKRNSQDTSQYPFRDPR